MGAKLDEVAQFGERGSGMVKVDIADIFLMTL